MSLSADGKTLATVLQKSTQTLYLLPAAGFTGNPPNPAPAQNKDSIFFDWTPNGDFYFDDGNNLISTQGTHCCQRAAITRSTDRGALGPGQMGGQGMQGLSVSEETEPARAYFSGCGHFHATLSLCRIIAPMYHTSTRWLWRK